MRRRLGGLLLGVLMGSFAACTGQTPSSAIDSPAGLRAAALDWSRAFLTGTVADIHSMEGKECRTPLPSPSIASAYLRAMRLEMQRFAGEPPSSIKVVGVQTRNVTLKRGDAEVQYALPEARAGNDNWVTYSYENGQWKVANCHAPIGGEQQSSSASASSMPTTSSSTTADPNSTPITVNVTGTGKANVVIDDAGVDTSHLGVDLPYTTTVYWPDGAATGVTMTVTLAAGNTSGEVDCGIDAPNNWTTETGISGSLGVLAPPATTSCSATPNGPS